MEEERMKKKLLFLLISVFLMLSLMPVSAMDIETTDQNPQYEEYVYEVLNSFYTTRTDAFEMYYGESEVNNKDLFYNQTRPMYMMRDYKGIVDYIIANEVMIVEDHYYGLNINQPNASTVSFNKSGTKTCYPVTGVPLVFTARFTGTYTKNDNNIITSINCSNTLTHNGSSNNYTVTISNKVHTQTNVSTNFTANLTFKCVVKYASLPQTFTYPSITMSVTIP